MFYDIKVSQNSIEIIPFLIPSVLSECHRGRVVNEHSDSMRYVTGIQLFRLVIFEVEIFEKQVVDIDIVGFYYTVIVL